MSDKCERARSPFPRSLFGMGPLKGFQGSPAVDVTETDNGYEITAELPGLDEKNIDVKLANGTLTIRGEKQDEREEKKTKCLMESNSTKWMLSSTKGC